YCTSVHVIIHSFPVRAVGGQCPPRRPGPASVKGATVGGMIMRTILWAWVLLAIAVAIGTPGVVCQRSTTSQPVPDREEARGQRLLEVRHAMIVKRIADGDSSDDAEGRLEAAEEEYTEQGGDVSVLRSRSANWLERHADELDRMAGEGFGSEVATLQEQAAA